MNTDRAIELMQIEKVCISRSSECDRNCGKCELVQNDMELLAAYDAAIEALKRPAIVPGVWERVSGREGGYDFRCSVCHHFRFHNGELRRYRFCPTCGNPMKREDEV